MSARPLNFDSGMPQVSSALNGWTKKITLQKITQTVDNFGLVTSTPVAFSFMGTVQPLSPKQLELKPEGQRSWTWLQIHVYSSIFDLDDNDEIVINGKIFKIMGKKDYSQSGYIEYHATYDYQP